MVDSKGVGQPFKFNGSENQDFAEWSSKMTTYLKAKFGHQVEEILKWAQNQRVQIAKDADDGESRRTPWPDVFPVTDENKNKAANIYMYLQSFTTGPQVL